MKRIGTARRPGVAAIRSCARQCPGPVREDAVRQELPDVELLDWPLEEDVAIRLIRTVEMRSKLARFPLAAWWVT